MELKIGKDRRAVAFAVCGFAGQRRPGGSVPAAFGGRGQDASLLLFSFGWKWIERLGTTVEIACL